MKRAKKQPKWTRVASLLAPDPRVSDAHRGPMRLVHVRLMLDDRGRLFEKVGRDPLDRLEDPPEE